MFFEKKSDKFKILRKIQLKLAIVLVISRQMLYNDIIIVFINGIYRLWEAVTYFMNERITGIIIHGLVLLTAFPIHESAHALAAHWLGDDTAKDQGRISMNPAKHLDLFGTIFMLIAGFGWARPVPINPNNFRNRKVGMALSSLAGPFSNLLLAYVSIILYKVSAYFAFSPQSPMSGAIILDAVSTVFLYSVFLNVGLAVFNLLPIPPLDGSRIFNLVLSEKAYFNVMKYENIIFGILFLAIFLGLLDRPLSFMQSKVIMFMDMISGWVDVLFL